MTRFANVKRALNETQIHFDMVATSAAAPPDKKPNDSLGKHITRSFHAAVWILMPVSLALRSPPSPGVRLLRLYEI